MAPTRDFLKKTFATTMTVVGLLFSYMSVIAYVEKIRDRDFSGFIGKMTEAYRKVLDNFSFVDPFVRSMAEYLRGIWDIFAFSPDWKYMFVPAFFYFGRAASISLRMDRKAIGCTQVVWGFLMAMGLSLTSAAAGSTRFLTVMALWFIGYDVVVSIARATFLRYRDETWWQTFAFHVKQRVGTDIAICAVAVAIFSHAPAGIPHDNAIFAIAFVVLAATRDLLTSFWQTLKDRAEPDAGGRRSMLAKWAQHGAFRHAVSVLVIIAAVTATILTQSG